MHEPDCEGDGSSMTPSSGTGGPVPPPATSSVEETPLVAVPVGDPSVQRSEGEGDSSSGKTVNTTEVPHSATPGVNRVDSRGAAGAGAGIGASTSNGVTPPFAGSPRNFSSTQSSVTVTAGGITATVTTSSDGTTTTTTTTQNTSTSLYSSINCPDLSDGVFPLTGVAGRSEKLQQLRISALDNYLHDDEEARIHALTPLEVVYEGGTGLIFTRPTPANVVRKCVYAYEDKYSFSRVLQPGMLLFDSHFECGNLHSAYLVTSNRDSDRASHSHTFYDLYMNEDVTTSAGAQWFYFSVSGNKAKQKVTFSIRNFYKQDSLFNEGMRPLVLSLKGRTTKSGEKRNGWTRCGYNISYRQETQDDVTYLPNPSTNSKKGTKKAVVSSRALKSILTFTHVFDEAQDTCFFAFCHPYTYSDLQAYLFLAEGKMQQNAAAAALSPRPMVYSKVPATKESSYASIATGDSKLIFYYRTKLCDTLAGNRCDLLVISSLDNIKLRENDPSVGMSVSDATSSTIPTPPLSQSSSSSTQRSTAPPGPSRFVKKSANNYYPVPGLTTPKSVPHIVISARVHPGETTASWSMQGFLDFILSSHYKAQELREKFVFLIVPMLNPDGVINGNNRTSLSGHDLNRNWRCPDPSRHPTIFYLKETTQNLVDRTPHDVLMYIDLHGHSRQKGAFTYGCLPDKNDIQQIREFFSAASLSNISTRNPGAIQSQPSIAAQNSVNALKVECNNVNPNVKSTGSVKNLAVNAIEDTTPSVVQKHIDHIQATPHVGTRGILSRGRKRGDDHLLNDVLDRDHIDNEDKTLHHSPRRPGQLCVDDENRSTASASDVSTKPNVSTHAPMLLRPASPILKQNSVTLLDDAKLSMNIDVNFDGYANNKTSMLYSNRGASLETENDKNVANAFAVGGELEKKFGTKEERVKSLPRIFMKRMLSFTQSHCSYKVPSAKLATSRAVMALEVGVECSYTLEISLAGDNKKLFQPTDLLNIGKAMGKSLHDWMHPALAYLETSKVLEDQERARQEQLDAYFSYNSKNKDRENRYGNRSRPNSASVSRARLTPSNSRGPSTATTNNMMMDLDTFVQINQVDVPVAKAKIEKSTTRKSSASGLTMEGHKVSDNAVNVQPRNTQKPSKDRPPRDGSGKEISKPLTQDEVKSTALGKNKHGEKVIYAGQKSRSASPRGELPYQASVLTPSLQVKHQLPEYIFDAADKSDILASPIDVQRSTAKKPSIVASIIPKLDLSVAPLSTQNSSHGGGSKSDRTSKSVVDNSKPDRKKFEKPFVRSAVSARKTDKEIEQESVEWDERLMLQNANSSTKSPRPSSLKDSLIYVQSSTSDNSSPTTRVEYQQKPQSKSRFRSESAKTRRSPKMAPARVSDVNWEERDAQAATTHFQIKVTTSRLKSAAQQRSSPCSPGREPRYVEERVTDNNFSSSAKGIVAEHKHSPHRSSPSKNMKTEGKIVLAEQLDLLRREYEESTRLLDGEDDAGELNLQSKEPGERQDAFSTNKPHTKSRSGSKRGVASKNNLHMQQQQQSQQELQRRSTSVAATKPPAPSFSVRIDGKKKKW